MGKQAPRTTRLERWTPAIVAIAALITAIATLITAFSGIVHI